ncbi:hypothetical protein M5C97_19395 [Acidovorax sp. NCPPB 3859]|nr:MULTISPECIES: hypothetical protein [unclassified Acidovorax]MDA8453084.1 hypothetical protein [Acidovorax sp. GBBC 3297]MDA8462492.1 hypothetical protein [Acidovorax sp. GBBC 3333]MDA8467525.1 hypothetical protein [Acidovorax sp. GBBC 3332]MDA8472560.1 hypothetical protein [Acidovorax sp. GBBC 3299]WCM77655.1 hypothetical protein M5C94_19345 [Acidovorax sp. GBBC 712]
MKKNIVCFFVVSGVVVSLAYFLFWIKSGIPNLDALVPATRCVKSAYNDENDRKRISVNCRDYTGKVQTVVVRKFYSKDDLAKMNFAFRNGVSLDGFLCTQLNGLHACFSENEKIMVSSIVDEAVIFYVLQYNEERKIKDR